MRALDMHGGEIYLIVDRGVDGAQVRRLQPSAWHFTERLWRGLSLRDALASGAQGLPDVEECQAVLADHLVSGRLTGFVRA